MLNGYPTDEELEKIKTWPWTDARGLMAFVRERWEYADWGWKEAAVQLEEDEPERYAYDISTGGWSGNEEFIGALKANAMFWALCWQQSRRGGHYIFQLPHGQ